MPPYFTKTIIGEKEKGMQIKRLKLKREWSFTMKPFLYLMVVVLCFSGLLFAENTVKIDAITTASWETKLPDHKGLKINGGTVYPTYAEIEWWDYYKNGDAQELKWGKTSTYDSTRNLQPVTAKTNTITKITGLEPKTKYYAEFHRIYGSKADISTKFEFTTPEATTDIAPAAKLTATPKLSAGTHVALFSITGQRVTILATNRYLAASALFAGTVAPGLYVARVLDANNMPIHSYQCMIGR